MKYITRIGAGLLFSVLLYSFTHNPSAALNWHNLGVDDTIKNNTLPFPFPDYSGTPSLFQKQSPLYLSNPSNIKSDVSYDPRTGKFVFRDQIGDFNYRTPYAMSFSDYIKYSSKKSEAAYWNERAALEKETERGGKNPLENFINPSIKIPGKAFDMIFGSNTISVKPQGSAELIFGLNIAKNYNAALPENQRKNVTFDFDEKIKMGLNGKIGEKMNLGFNYDTEATFDFENNIKLAYEGEEDDIIQKLEAGNVSLPLTGSLITGSHSLFGIKTELKFGNLTVTSVASQQKSESKTIEIEGGALTTPFEITADAYEPGKHFFLSYYFREYYNDALKDLPIIRSGVTITKVEVWVTNRSGNFDNSRNVVGLTDLGEPVKNLYSDEFTRTAQSNGLPHNEENSLYQEINDLPGIRNINNVGNVLATITNFNAGEDYEKVQNARLLTSSEYSFHPTLGYISLNSGLNNDEVLAVAYEFQAGGQVYRVGEFSTESQSDVLFLKLLKTTTLSTELPTWNLMMKNVYAINAYQVNREDFVLNIFYNDDKTGTQIDYIPAGRIDGQRLLQVMNLDNLNNNNDPGRDGFFDFLDKVTINATNGRIYFPVLEPFGQHLRMEITGGDTLNPELNRIAEQYMFPELYAQTQSQARQVAEKNKFIIKGEYRSAGGSEISLNALNIPEGSVQVTAGGRQLTENTDYTVDYNLGRVTILNHSLLESGTPIKISLENNSMFSIGTKTMVGTHLDYRFSENFNLGGTVLHLSQKPLTSKVSIGNEPISNTIWGLDLNYSHEVPFLTTLVDKIPFIETKETSSIQFQSEFAHFIPGYPKVIGKEGYTHIDDFESTKTTIDLKNPGAWHLASTPQGQPLLFPEGDLRNNLENGYNRARFAWYSVNPDFQQGANSLPDYITVDAQSDHRIREVYEQELFPDRDPVPGYPPLISILNLAFYPSEKGPYNFDALQTNGISAGVDADGNLLAPQTRWGGIMRDLITNDFEEANIEFIEFWMMDPFIYDETHSGGDLYFNLGSISEDILRDSRQAFENGLSATAEVKDVDSTAWGRVPLLPRITDGFANEPQEARNRQDAGLDGLRGDAEVSFYQTYLQSLQSIGQTAYEKALEDASNDDYLFFKDPSYDSSQASILERYKRYNSMEGNSSTSENATTITAGQLLPDMEDVNRDYTLSELEAYFQYKLNISPAGMQIGQNYITDIREGEATLRNEQEAIVKWYHFKIPLSDYEKKIGPIQDFKSIRFMRLYMHGWDEEVVLRFAEMDLVRSEWRKYTKSLLEGGEGTGTPQITDAPFDISAVNIEENASKAPVNYVLPPDITREISPDNPTLRELNEQAIVMRVFNLDDGDARAAYKNMSMDVRQFKKIQMYTHAEAVDNEILNDNDICMFIRIGSDYKENYYEYEIPLKVTPPGFYDGGESSPDREIVWNLDNMLDIEFEILQAVKQNRNTKMREIGSTLQITSLYSEFDDETKRRVSIIGNPNLSNVRTIMLGIRNRSRDINEESDDGLPKSVEVWMNELRLAGFNEDGGWAAQGRLTAKLADFSTLAIAGNISTPGFGSIEKRVNERQKSTDYGYDASSNFELGKFFPKKYGVRLPLYAGRSETFSDPQYNPVDPDILLRTTLSNPNLTQADKNEILRTSQDYVLRQSINVTNIKIAGNSEKTEETGTEAGDDEEGGPMGGGMRRSGAGGGSSSSGEKPFYHISNWTASVGYNEVFMRNISTDHNILKEHTGMIAYNFNKAPKNIVPFQKTKSKFLRSKPLKLVKDFNFYYMPSMVSVRNEMSRSFHEVQMRNIEQPDILLDTTFDKSFNWQRTYDVRYNLTKAIKLTYNATNAAWVDEPYGRLDKESDYWQQKRDTVWTNIKDFGRTTQFSQRISGTWTIPINKVPLLDWTSANAQYDADFFWDQGPRVLGDSLNLGNNARNAQNFRLTTQFNLTKVYTQVPYLKKVDDKFKGTKRPKTEKKTVTYEEKEIKLKKDKAKKITHNLKTEDVTLVVKDAEGNEVKGKTEVLNENKIVFTPEADIKDAVFNVTGQREVPENFFIILTDYTLYALMGVRNVSINYSQNGGTVVPGYMPTTRFFGYDKSWAAPGINFLLADQDRAYGELASRNGWLTTDTLLNSPITMTSTQTIDARATVEPLKGFKIDLTAERSITDDMSQYWVFRDGDFRSENEQFKGNFRISTLTINTAFENFEDTTYQSGVFKQFLDNRLIIAERLAAGRLAQYPGYDPSAPVDVDSVYEELSVGFPNGYNSVSQDVLIPAFLAAYSGQSAEKVFSGTFPKFPLPNWRIKYDGLTNFKVIKKLVKKVIINHGYNSKFQINSYATSLFFDFDDFEQYGYSGARKDDDQTFYPRYFSSGVSIDEKFVPLIGVDVTLNNDMSFGFDYKKARRLDLSFENNRLMESTSEDYTISFGHKIPDLELPLQAAGKPLKSDLNLRADLTMMRKLSVIRSITEETNQLVVPSNRSFSLKMYADYDINSKVTVKLFYEQDIRNPLISAEGYKTSNTKVGFSIRFKLI